MKRVLACVLTVFLVIPLFAIAPAHAADDPQDQLDKLLDIAAIIREFSIDSKSNDPLYDALIELLEKYPELYDTIKQLMTDKLDQYSHVFSETEYDKYYPTGISFAGLGVNIETEREEGIVISDVMKDSPAAKAGLKVGDYIVKVDKLDVTEFPPTAAATVLRGEEGSKVVLSVARKGINVPLTFTITRAMLTVSNIAYQDMGDGVGYFRIYGFGSVNDFAEFTTLYENIAYDGIRSVIIDLRDNPGGDMDVMYNMLNYMVEKAGVLMFAVRSKKNVNGTVYETTGAGKWTPNKIIVLVNEHTASAAEVFAGALKGQHLAETIGVKTYGKGRGQYVFWIGKDKDTAAVITSVELVVPEQEEYDKIGITPDHIVPLKLMPHPTVDMEAFSARTAILPTVDSARVKALEERLAFVGAFTGTPDNRWNGYTLYALNAYQRANMLRETNYANVDTLTVLDKEIQTKLSSEVTFDTQLELALEGAREAAKEPLKKPLPEKQKK